MAGNQQQELERLALVALDSADQWAEIILGLRLHPWQREILDDLSHLRPRKQVAVRAPNGAGKDAMIIAPLALWWIRRFPRGRVVITSKESRQLKEQTWRAIASHRALYADCKPVDSEYRLTTPEGGFVSAFTTDEPERAEGYHAEEGSPLLMIINEAKSVPNGIFDAFSRCGYSVLLEISTGGLKEGRFFEHFTDDQAGYERHTISLLDCPHISKEKIDQLTAYPGLSHPLTRSTLFGEFMEADELNVPVFSEQDIKGNLDAHIEALMGPTVVGCDFGAGNDENVIVRRCGNHVPSGGIVPWKDPDTIRAAAMFSHHFDRLRIEPGEVWGDSAGLGVTFCDLLSRHWKINRVNACEKSPDKRYVNMGAYLWFEVANKVRLHHIKLPNHPELIKQLKSRRAEYDNETGKLGLEDKKEMRKRGVSSPDIADAFCLAFGVTPIQSVSWMRGDDSRYEDISRQHGWQYSGPDDDQESDGRPGRGDSGGSPFGYLSSW